MFDIRSHVGSASVARLQARSTTSAFAFALALAALPAVAGAQTDEQPLLFREPALSQNEICFTFGSDLWLVPRAGGNARRLTASAGSSPESSNGDCSFSPDGKWIAFTTTTGRNSDAYVIAAAGGLPRRLTYHPGVNRVRGWTPDGKVLLLSTRESYTVGTLSSARLYTQALDRVAPAAIDLPSGWDGSFSADGKRLAYMPIANANEIWKRYRGGRTSPIWIATLSDAAIEKVPRENSSDTQPMWVGDTVFFLSDRDGPITLFSYDTKSKKVTKRLNNSGLDIKNASAGPGAIVYEQFGSIRLYDLTSGKDAPVAIRLTGELASALPHWVAVSEKLEHPSISPTGVRAAFEAHGEIITVPAKEGRRARHHAHASASRNASPRGPPTARRSRTSPTPAARTTSSCADRPESSRPARSSSARMTRTTTRQCGRPMESASPTATLELSSSSPMSQPEK